MKLVHETHDEWEEAGTLNEDFSVTFYFDASELQAAFQEAREAFQRMQAAFYGGQMDAILNAYRMQVSHIHKQYRHKRKGRW